MSKQRERQDISEFAGLIAAPVTGEISMPANARVFFRSVSGNQAGTVAGTITGPTVRTIHAPALAAGEMTRAEYVEADFRVSPAFGFDMLVDIGLGRTARIGGEAITDLFQRLGASGMLVDPINQTTVWADTGAITQAVIGGQVARIDTPASSPVAAQFAQADPAKRPILRADGLEFDGSDDMLFYPDDLELRFGATDFTIAFAYRADSAARRRAIIDKAELALGPELAQEFTAFVRISGGGTTTNNGDGTFTISGDTVSRASIPLSFLTNGATYRIELEIISTTHPTLETDWCDYGDQILSGITGVYSYTASRLTHDATFRFLDVQSSGAGSTTFRLASFRKVQSAAGWGVRHQDAALRLAFLPSGSMPSEITVAPAAIAAGVWLDCIIAFDRSANTATATTNGAERAPMAIPVGDISGAAALSLGFADGGGGVADGRIGRILVIDKRGTPDDRALINNWLAAGHS